MKFQDLLSKLQGVRVGADENSYTALCPAHDDKTPSLSVSLKDGRILVHCFAGCATERICGALGIEPKDLFENGASHAPAPGSPLDPSQVLPAEYFDGSLDHFAMPAKAWQFPKAANIERLYPYADEDFNLLYYKVRRIGKEFLFCRFDEGRTVWSAKGIRRVLYRLPQVLAAKSAGKIIFITEGEKDADAVVALGLHATTHDNGAGKGYDLYAGTLADATMVVVMADNDAPGLDHAHRVAVALHGKVEKVRVVVLPGEGKDVSDWITAGGDRASLQKIVADTPDWKPESAPAKDELTDLAARDSYTDMRNALRLVEKFGADIRYCSARKKWLVWTGKVWRWDAGGAVITEHAKEVVRELLKDSVNREYSFRKFAIASGQEPRIRAMVALARTSPVVNIHVDDLDFDSFLFNCSNGVVDLRTGNLRDHSREDFITKITPVEFDPDRDAPRWFRFMEEIFGGDHDLIDWVQRAVGYSLTGDTREQVFFFAWGRGSNGKSRFLQSLRYSLGSFHGGYVVCLPFSTFTNNNPNAIPADLAMLPGARMATASETMGAAKFNEERIKSVTGDDPITARNLHESFFTFVSTAKLWLAANDKPIVHDDSFPFWRRVRLIPFLQTFNPSAEPDLDKKLYAEAPGILAWAVRGTQQWIERGLTGTPECVRLAGEEYKDEQDPLAGWLEDNCEQSPGNMIQARDAYQNYLNWADNVGMKAGKGALTMTKFGLLMKGRFGYQRTGEGRFYEGICTKEHHSMIGGRVVSKSLDGIL